MIDVNIEPIRGKHAIEMAVFVLELSEASVEQIERLVEKASQTCSTAAGFTVQNPMNEMELVVENGKSSFRHRILGKEFIKLGENNQPEWSLSVGAKMIVCTCFVYDRWASVKDFTLSLLFPLVAYSEEIGLTISALTLEYQDVFSCRDVAPKIATESIFNLNSGYLTSSIKSYDSLWHVNQGWFEELGSDNVVLNVVNVNTLKNGPVVTARIHSVHRITGSGVLDGGALTKIEIAENLINWLEKLHDMNKKMLGDLLSDKAKIIISLG